MKIVQQVRNYMYVKSCKFSFNIRKVISIFRNGIGFQNFIFFIFNIQKTLISNEDPS